MSERISVLHLLHTIAYGGVESMILNWLRVIDRSRFDVRLACFANPGDTQRPFVEEAARRGFEVATIPWARYKPLIRSTRALTKLLRSQPTQILHTHNFYADCVGVLAAAYTPVKTISTVSVWGRYGWKRDIIQALNAFVLRFVDQVSVHCEDTLRSSVQRGFDAAKLKTLICGFETHPTYLSTAERSARRRTLGITDQDIVLVNLARLYPEKRQRDLLHAFSTIVQRYPQTQLWIVGIGPLEAELKALCHQLGLDSKVRFLGWIDHLAEVLSIADIQVHPSMMEGVSLAIGEGMAAGLPIIASDVGGMSEVLTNQKTGILIQPGDDAALIEETLRLIADPAERRRLGDSARQFITQDYSLTSAAQRVEQAYIELLYLQSTGC